MHNRIYRIATGIAMGASLLLVWLSLGVGIIGKDGDPANRMYLGVIAAGFMGTLLAKGQARGMSRALLITALAQGTVGLIAVITGLGRPWSGPLELILLNGFFVIAFIGSAYLYRKVAREQDLMQVA